MEMDEASTGDVYRRQIELAERELDRAAHDLQRAGKSAYDELRKARYTSGRIALAIRVDGSTVRKLNSDGDKSGWRPLSRRTYESLDACTRRWLGGTSWDLTALRDAFDRATHELATARKRRDEALADAEADRLGRRAELGVLYLPGHPERRADLLLRQLGDALAGSFAASTDGRTSVQVVEAQLDADRDEPARLVLQRSPREGGGDRGDDGDIEAESRWMVAVSPVTHTLDDRDLRPFLCWLAVRLPWLVEDELDRRALKAKCLPGAWLHRWLHTALNWIGAGFVPPAALTGITVLLLLLLASFLPGAQVISRAAGRLLFRSFGLTFAHARSVTTLDVQASQAARHLYWLRRHCRQIAVVAHGQGVPVAHRLVCHSPKTVAFFATLGSPLRRFRFVRALQGRAAELSGAFGWTFMMIMLASLLVAVLALLVLVIAFLISGAAGTWLSALAVAGGILLPPALIAVITRFHRAMRGGLVAVRMDALEQLSSEKVDARWTDFSTATDLLADGPYLAAANPLGDTHVEVLHLASMWADHRAYLRPDAEALYRLTRELATIAAPPVRLEAATRLAREPGQRRRRLRWLVAARWVSALSGLLSAVALRQAALEPTDPRHAVVLVALWVLCGVAAYALLKGCWTAWDHAHRLHHIAPGKRSAAPTPLHLYVGFIYLLQLLTLAVVGPLLVMAGWWGALLRKSAGVLAFVAEGNPVFGVELVIFALVMVVVLAGPALGSVLALPAVHGRLERRSPPPSPVAAAGLLLRRLPRQGLKVGGAHYRVARVGWDLAVRPFWFWRRGRPFRSPDTALMLLRDNAVLLDLREGRVIDTGRGNWDAHVHGDRVYDAEEPAGALAALRLARHRDWRAFRRDLPELLDFTRSHSLSA
jgi:hypothetical protein